MSAPIGAHARYPLIAGADELLDVFTWLLDNGNVFACDRCAEHRRRRVRLTLRYGQVKTTLGICSQCACDLIAEGLHQALEDGRMPDVVSRLGLVPGVPGKAT